MLVSSIGKINVVKIKNINKNTSKNGFSGEKNIAEPKSKTQNKAKLDLLA